MLNRLNLTNCIDNIGNETNEAMVIHYCYHFISKTITCYMYKRMNIIISQSQPYISQKYIPIFYQGIFNELWHAFFCENSHNVLFFAVVMMRTMKVSSV